MSVSSEEVEYLAAGSLISCSTCHGQSIKGEVLAFDGPAKMIALRTLAANNKSHVQFVNLALITDLRIEKEGIPEQESAPLVHLNFDRLNRRVAEAVQLRKRFIRPNNVSLDGQKVFMAVSKTIEDCCWENNSILVLKCVLIQPPYRVQDVMIRPQQGNTSQAQSTLAHVKKLVEKHLNSDRSSVGGSVSQSSRGASEDDTT